MDLDEHGGHAHAQDEYVGEAEVQQEEVRRVAQVAVVPDDDGHEAVADEAHHEDEAARERHQEAHVRREAVVGRRLRRRRSVRVVPQRGVRLERRRVPRRGPAQFGGVHRCARSARHPPPVSIGSFTYLTRPTKMRA